jgi:hypothetical protein
MKPKLKPKPKSKSYRFRRLSARSTIDDCLRVLRALTSMNLELWCYTKPNSFVLSTSRRDDLSPYWLKTVMLQDESKHTRSVYHRYNATTITKGNL